MIFASVFPGYDAFADEMERYYSDRARREQVRLLQSLRDRAAQSNGHSILSQEIERRIGELEQAIAKEPYSFDRRFLFRALSMGHSQFAELIGARGPNTQLNFACANTTQAVSLAEDWIRAVAGAAGHRDLGRRHCLGPLIEWFGAGRPASGAGSPTIWKMSR